MLNVVAFTENSQRKIFIAYDQLLQDPHRECTRLGRFLDEQCEVSPKDADQRVEQMTAQISAKQYHFQHPQALAKIKVTTKEQRALYNFLRLKTMYPEEPFIQDDFALYPGWMEYIQAMDMLFSSNEKQDN
jgi:hypothetical protein